MPSWGNTDRANSKPNFSEMREVRAIADLVTANATLAGTNEIIFTTNPADAGVANGMIVYATANNGLSRFFDASIIDANDIDFKRSNNTVKLLRTGAANIRIQFANNTIAPIAAGEIINFATAINYGTNAQAQFANDVILVTGTRMANTQGVTAPLAGGGSTVANTKLGSVNQGWNRITRKINNDGTIRFLKETLVALANASASNTSSANTSANAIYGGL
jgi:hypothetical protein